MLSSRLWLRLFGVVLHVTRPYPMSRRGDSSEMLRSRRAFLDAGHYAVIQAASALGTAGGTTSKLTSHPVRPATIGAPAHRCTGHHTPSTWISAAK